MGKNAVERRPSAGTSWLEAARIERNLSVTHAARQIGLDSMTLRRLELMGVKQPSLRVIHALAEFYEVPVRQVNDELVTHRYIYDLAASEPPTLPKLKRPPIRKAPQPKVDPESTSALDLLTS